MDKKILYKLKLFLLLLSMGFFANCSFNYGTELDKNTLPDLSFTNLDQVVYQDGKLELSLHADRAETFKATNQTQITNMSFAEYNKNGEIITHGSAKKALFFSDSEDAQFADNIELNSQLQDIAIKGDFLRWKAEDKVLAGRRDGYILLKRGDGSSIQGKGFAADARRLTFVFNGGIQGDIPTNDTTTDTNATVANDVTKVTTATKVTTDTDATKVTTATNATKVTKGSTTKKVTQGKNARK